MHPFYICAAHDMDCFDSTTNIPPKEPTVIYNTNNLTKQGLIVLKHMAKTGSITQREALSDHSASKQTFKVLIENDEVPKALAEMGYTMADLDASNPYTQGITTP